MIGKIQSNQTFQGVFIKRSGNAANNIKRAYDNLADSDSFFSGTNSDFYRKNFDAILKYGLEQLNDKNTDDGETRYLTFESVSDEDGFGMGFDLGIVDKDGNKFSSGSSLAPCASVLALKNAFDDLCADYKRSLASYAVKHYEETCSSLDSVIAPYLKNEGPENS